MKTFFVLSIMAFTCGLYAQDKPYYYTIPEAPKAYTAATVAARLVDGLGFRYFWATEGLTKKDLAFKPSDSARTSYETLQHIEGLTSVLLNAVSKQPTVISTEEEKLSFAELRKKTLMNIQSASEILKKPDANLEEFDMIFKRPDRSRSFPFWNLVNGPISDALWHVGQVVSFRRSSGNPLPEGVNVLTGKKTN
ncbi:hypothetical protein JNL27_15015 [bacterium]|nr:hypothetical protein [bacterium]